MVESHNKRLTKKLADVMAKLSAYHSAVIGEGRPLAGTQNYHPASAGFINGNLTVTADDKVVKVEHDIESRPIQFKHRACIKKSAASGIQRVASAAGFINAGEDSEAIETVRHRFDSGYKKVDHEGCGIENTRKAHTCDMNQAHEVFRVAEKDRQETKNILMGAQFEIPKDAPAMKNTLIEPPRQMNKSDQVFTAAEKNLQETKLETRPSRVEKNKHQDAEMNHMPKEHALKCQNSGEATRAAAEGPSQSENLLRGSKLT
jgi:hypothetical protein